MSHADFRAMIDSEEFHPFIIRTKDGRSYSIRHRSNAHIGDAYPETVILLVPERGITLLALDAIESIQFAHEAASAR